MAVVVPPPKYQLGLKKWEHWTLQKDELDVVAYALQKFVGLLLHSNPNVVGLLWLRAEHFAASPLNVGTGTVTMSHGTFPVPAPATARLVQGVPVYGAGEGELLTPTGALLVTGHATSYGPLPLLRPEAIGHGAGSRDTPGRSTRSRSIRRAPARPRRSWACCGMHRR